MIVPFVIIPKELLNKYSAGDLVILGQLVFLQKIYDRVTVKNKQLIQDLSITKSTAQRGLKTLESKGAIKIMIIKNVRHIEISNDIIKLYTYNIKKVLSKSKNKKPDIDVSWFDDYMDNQ